MDEKDKRIAELEEQVLQQDALLGNPNIHVDARLYKLEEELKKADARLLFMLNHMHQPTVKVLTKLSNQINAIFVALDYYANLDNWEEDMEGHASYRNKIKDDSDDHAGILRWVRKVGGKRARLAVEEFKKIEEEFMQENLNAVKNSDRK